MFSTLSTLIFTDFKCILDTFSTYSTLIFSDSEPEHHWSQECDRQISDREGCQHWQVLYTPGQGHRRTRKGGQGGQTRGPGKGK